jgi:hypothetical protein
MGLKAATAKEKFEGIMKPWPKGNFPSIVSARAQPSRSVNLQERIRAQDCLLQTQDSLPSMKKVRQSLSVLLSDALRHPHKVNALSSSTQIDSEEVRCDDKEMIAHRTNLNLFE